VVEPGKLYKSEGFAGITFFENRSVFYNSVDERLPYFAWTAGVDHHTAAVYICYTAPR